PLAHRLELRLAELELTYRRLRIAGQELDLRPDQRPSGPAEPEAELLIAFGRLHPLPPRRVELAAHRVQRGEHAQRAERCFLGELLAAASSLVCRRRAEEERGGELSRDIRDEPPVAG